MKPSTDWFFLTILITGIVVVGCTPRSSGVVEAPMMSADASASAIAFVSERATAPTPNVATDAPFKPGDRLTGYYTCNQGKTAMVLIIEEVVGIDDETADVEAIFEFHYDGTKTGFAKTDGSARLRGKYESKGRRLRLKGEEWIDQPTGYSLITLVGSINKSGGYAGSVEGQGCTSFSAIPEKAATNGQK